MCSSHHFKCSPPYPKAASHTLTLLCGGCAVSVPQKPNPTHCLHHALEGVTTESVTSASPLHTACKKNAPSTTTQKAQVMLPPEKWCVSYLNGVMSANQKMLDLDSSARLPTIPNFWSWFSRRQHAEALQQQLGLHMEHPSGCTGFSDSLCCISTPLPHSWPTQMLIKCSGV